MKRFNLDNCAVFITTNTSERQKVFSNHIYAQIIVDALRFGSNQGWYRLISFVVMPDHVHFIIVPKIKTLSDIMKTIKGYTARKIDLLRKSSRHIWQRDYYAMAIDKIEFVYQKLKYIENNPVRSNLVKNPADYPFSSAGKYDELELSDLY